MSIHTAEEICRKTAKHFEGKDWHKLTQLEQDIVYSLEIVGILEKKECPDGFVGKAL